MSKIKKANYDGYFEKVIMKIIKPSLRKMESVIKNSKKYDNLEKAIKNAKYTKKQEYWDAIGRPLLEAHSSLERQRFFPKLLQSYSSNYEKQGFSRVKQFIYHIENYLNESYILHQRVLSFFSLLKKKARETTLDPTSIEFIDILRKTFDGQMKNLLSIRGKHIHESRLRLYETDSLEKIDIYLSQELSKDKRKMFEGHRKILLMIARNEWKKKMRENNDNMIKVLDNLFFHLDKRSIIQKIAREVK